MRRLAACTAVALAGYGIPAFAQERVAGEGPLRAAVRRLEAPPQKPSSQRPSLQNPGWLVRHPVVAGTLIGAGSGLALSHVDAIGGAGHDPRVAVIGAGAGAWTGLIASAVHKARTGEKVGPGVKTGIVIGAAALVALPVLACYGAGGCGGSS